VWAIGDEMGTGEPAVVLHWDGRAWERVHLPTREEMAEAPGHILVSSPTAVLALGPDDVWLIGSGGRARVRQGNVETTGGSVPAVVHWDGHDWTVSIPGDGLAADDWGELTGAGRGLDGSAWAVGQIWVADNSQTVAYRLDGSRWVETPTPFIAPAPRHMDDGRSNALVGISATASGEVWAVGHYFTAESEGLLPLVERCG
jgi:hypothetical protein